GIGRDNLNVGPSYLLRGAGASSSNLSHGQVTTLQGNIEANIIHVHHPAQSPLVSLSNVELVATCNVLTHSPPEYRNCGVIPRPLATHLLQYAVDQIWLLHNRSRPLQ